MKFCALVPELYLPQSFFHTQPDRHILKTVKSCSEHPKTCEVHQKPKVENSYFLLFVKKKIKHTKTCKTEHFMQTNEFRLVKFSVFTFHIASH